MAQSSVAILNDWVHYLRTQKHYSEKTCIAYEHDVERLLELYPNRLFDTLTSQEIRYALAKLHQSGMQPKSLSRVLSAWRSFYRWYKTGHVLKLDPTTGVKAPKVPQPIPKALSVDQTQSLLSPKTLAQTDFNRLKRDQAMFELLYASGLRLSELVGLDYQYHQTKDYRSVGWIHLEEKELTITGKGQKTRILPMGQMAIDAVNAWLEVRPLYVSEKTVDNSEYALFLGARGGRINPRTVQKALEIYGLSSQLNQAVNPHVLRHSFASHLLQSSQDLRAVQELLGHSHITTTQIYTKLDHQHLQKVYEKSHPRAKRKK